MQFSGLNWQKVNRWKKLTIIATPWGCFQYWVDIYSKRELNYLHPVFDYIFTPWKIARNGCNSEEKKQGTFNSCI